MPRLRKAGDRYPSGDLRREATINQIRRGRDAVLATGKHPEFGTMLGWLTLPTGPGGLALISPAQCEAGLTFARLWQSMAREMGLPARAPRSCALGEGSGRGGTGEPNKHTSAVLAAYRAARDRLEAVGALDVVVAVCVDDQAPPRWDRAKLVRGLRALME